MSATAARSAVPTLARHFITKKRGRGPKAPSFVSLRDSAPQWLRDACYEAHFSDLPNDWIYDQIHDACRGIDDGYLTDDDSLHEYADSAADIYTSDLFAWAANLCQSSTFSYAEDALRDMGGSGDKDTAGRLGMIQYCAIEAIAATILHAYETARDESGVAS